MKKKLLSIFIALASVCTMFVAPETTYAATVTVSSKSELTSAISSAKAGTEIVLKNGTYNDLGEIKIAKSGSQTNKITLRPQTPGGVRFTGKVTFYFQGSYIVIKDFYFDQIHFDKNSGYSTTNLIKFSGAKHCEFTGNYIYNCGNATDMGSTGSGIYGMYTPIVEMSKGSRYNIISNNVFQDNFSISVALVADTNYDNSYNVIENNYFRDISSVYSWWGNVSSGNGMECIQIGQNADTKTMSTYTTIRNNLFENIGGDGAEVVSIKTSDNTIEHNTFRLCSGGLVLRTGNNNIADGNFMFYTKGIRVYEDGHIVRNNYIADSQVGIHLDGSDGKNHYAATNVKVYNNTIVNAEQFGVKIGASSSTEYPSDIMMKNNYVIMDELLSKQYKAYKDFGSSNPQFNKNLCTVIEPSYQGVSVGVSRTVLADMVLSGELYRPGPESSLINNSDYIEGFEYDMDGQKRIGKPDCGADEYSEEAIKYVPLNIAGPTDKWWQCVMYNGYDESGIDTGIEFKTENGRITASRTVEPFKTGSASVNKTIIFAEYDGDRLVEMVTQAKNIYEPDIYDYSVSLDYTEGHTYKAFWWDMSEGKCIPLETVKQYR